MPPCHLLYVVMPLVSLVCHVASVALYVAQDRQYTAQYETQEFVLSTEPLGNDRLVVGQEPKPLGTLGKAKSFFGSPGSGSSAPDSAEKSEKKKPGIARRMSAMFSGSGAPKAEAEL